MENEIQPLEPSIEPSIDNTNQQGLLPNGEIDHEGAMAKADLFKLGQYSYKLFKKIQDDDQLESWVQAKITKAADYITSVYHYLEFEMKFNEYGKKLDDSDVLSESERVAIKAKLSEAREMMRYLKIAQAQKLSEGKIAETSEKEFKNQEMWRKHDQDTEKLGDAPDIGALSAFKKKHEKAKAKKEKQLDEVDKSTLRSYAKAASQDLVDKSTKLAKTDSSKKQAELGRKVVNRTRGIATAVDKMEESKPSAGLSKAKKSKFVKDAKAGKDIGKPGKNFDKVAKKAGGGEKGKRIAAAAMWKNIKEGVEMAFGEGVYAEDQQLDELDLKPWEKKSPFSKKGYQQVAHRQTNKMQDAETATDAADEKGDNAGIKQAGQDWKQAKARKEKALRKADLAKKESINESADLTTIKMLSGLK